MDKRVQYAVVVLIVVLVAAAWLTRDTGSAGPGSNSEAAPPPAPAPAVPETSVDAAPSADGEDAEAAVAESTSAPAEDSEAGAEEARQLPRFVEVGADSCVPCRMMQPILAELRSEYAGKLEVEFADVWKHPELGERYQVRSIPTQIIYDAEGREVFRHIGYWPREEIDAKLKELGIVE